jgi:hypothetical protein
MGRCLEPMSPLAAQALGEQLSSPILRGLRIVLLSNIRPMKFVLYSKPGCHLCEGLQAKLETASHLPFELEVRDITTQEDWFARYQYEIPVLCRVVETPAGLQEQPLPRLSPRAPQARVEQMIQTHLGQIEAE